MRPHASTEHIDWKKLARENTAKLQEIMEKHDLDGVIVGSMNNIIWLTGVPMTTDYPYFFTHIALLNRTEEEPILLSPYVRDFFPEEENWLEDVRAIPLPRRSKTRLHSLTGILKLSGLSKILILLKEG